MKSLTVDQWQFQRLPPNVMDNQLGQMGLGFDYTYLERNGDVGVLVPHWFAVILMGALSATPWLRWRFRPALC
jgi:hypothetical protein